MTLDVADVAEPRAAAPRGPVRFRPSVVLTKGEAFAACQVLADADRCLVRAGHFDEADGLGDLFQLLEGRMTSVDRCPDSRRQPAGASVVGSYSMDSEFTQ